MFDSKVLIGLMMVFAPLSLVSFGGGPTILAPMQHQAVDVHHWLTNEQFIDLFAVSRASPGPGTLIAPLIGFKVYGWIGAIVACLALYIPSSLIVYAVGLLWGRFSQS